MNFDNNISREMEKMIKRYDEQKDEQTFIVFSNTIEMLPILTLPVLSYPLSSVADEFDNIFREEIIRRHYSKDNDNNTRNRQGDDRRDHEETASENHVVFANNDFKRTWDSYLLMLQWAPAVQMEWWQKRRQQCRAGG